MKLKTHILQFISLIFILCFSLIAQVGEQIPVTHIGPAEATIVVTIVDPDSLTGHDYEVFLNQQHYYMDIDGEWKETNYPDSVGKSIGKPGDVSASSLSAIAYNAPTSGTTLVGTQYLITVKDGTGSMALIDGARGYSLADHPLDTPFMVRIPFEVWIVDDNMQINFVIYDRKGDPKAAEFEAFNRHDRMFTHFVLTPYKENVLTNDDLDKQTWNLVWWDAEYKKGDKLNVVYPDLLSNKDQFLFTAPAGMAIDQSISIYEFNLSQNYPNPFNPKTVISYHLPVVSKVELNIYNILGQKVAILVSEPQQIGNYKYEWDASGFASGVYLYRLSTSTGYVQTKKLVYLK